mmetsp:Transcript_11384/g.32342  ORF Transcript_11384/g.32342 Transcript_11384/m.32342 type:complete len:136 (+) Transcript_11384:209-616(+)
METRKESWRKFKSGGKNQRNKKKFGRMSIRKISRKRMSEHPSALEEEEVVRVLVEAVDVSAAVAEALEEENAVVENVDEELLLRRQKKQRRNQSTERPVKSLLCQCQCLHPSLESLFLWPMLQFSRVLGVPELQQ